MINTQFEINKTSSNVHTFTAPKTKIYERRRFVGLTVNPSLPISRRVGTLPLIIVKDINDPIELKQSPPIPKHEYKPSNDDFVSIDIDTLNKSPNLTPSFEKDPLYLIEAASASSNGNSSSSVELDKCSVQAIDDNEMTDNRQNAGNTIRGINIAAAVKLALANFVELIRKI